MSKSRSFAQHLDPAVGPKRILAFDGGGLRGVLTLSRNPTAREIDREMGTTGTPLCSNLRYNVQLKSEWCEQHLGERIGPKALKALEAMDEPDNTPEPDRLGRLAGQRLVKAAHFTTTFDLH